MLSLESVPSESTRAYLLVVDPGALESTQLGRRFMVPERGLLIGTNPLSDIPLLPGLFQKPYHVRVFRNPGEHWQFRHQEQDETLYVNQRPFHTGYLKDGDILQIGLSAFEFLVDTGPRLRIYQELESRTRIDHLTKVQTRKSMIEHIEREMSRLSRNPADVFSLVLFNLDHFTEINDVHGYHGGDEVLRTVARRLEQGLRKHELVGRYAGEEFLVLLPGVTQDRVHGLAEILRARVQNQPIVFLEKTIPITLSGSTITALSQTSFQGLLQILEDRIALAKETGRNRIISS